MKQSVQLPRISALALAACCAAFCCPRARAQENPTAVPAGPAAAVSDALTAACTGNQVQFADELTSESAAAFRALSSEERSELMRRFSLTEDKGRPLLSSDPESRIILRCETPGNTIEFRFGDTSVHENLAFVPVSVVGAEQTKFGLVRESSGWRIISLGLLLVDIPALSKQWEDDQLEQQENAVVEALAGLKQAIERYRNAFGKLPDSLAQLGPAAPGQISPDEASLVGKELASGVAGGYHFSYRVVATADPNNKIFELGATPEEYGKAGRRSFFIDGAGRIHAQDKHGAAATSDDPQLETETAHP
ncbi:MAG TPA: hypothetical protein VEJ67_16165 [Candidatus Cybelea sp.]|nr:hypothetical protein [Candidatus Cybelea sp.]